MEVFNKALAHPASRQLYAFDFADQMGGASPSFTRGRIDPSQPKNSRVTIYEATGKDWNAAEAKKRYERNAKGADSALDGVAIGLPALLRAEKLQKRAARTGFDWPDPSGARAKIDEELAEVETATSDAGRAEEIGDLLFAVVNWARKLGVDPEAALRAANGKFERRFRAMEAADDRFAERGLAEQESLWRRAKAAE